MNSAVLREQHNFFVHQFFKTDRSRGARTFLQCVTTGSCGICLFTTHDASEGRCKKGKERVRIFYYFLKNLVDMLKSLVATAYIDCTAYARPVSDFA